MEMFWKKTGLVFIQLAALAIVCYGQTHQPANKGRSATIGGPQGYLGLGVMDQKDHPGVMVMAVTPGGPGAVSGVKVGDFILEIDGQTVVNQTEFTGTILSKSPGAKVVLTIARNGRNQNVDAVLGSRPPGLPLNSMPVEPGTIMPAIPMMPEDFSNAIFGDTSTIGLDSEPLTAQLAEFFGVHEGALVRNVMPNSAADKAGLKAGDVVTKIDGMPVSNPREISALIRLQKKKTYSFTVVHNRKEVTYLLTL